MQSVLLSYLLSQTTIIFSDYPSIWIASFMVYAFHGSTILQSGVYISLLQSHFITEACTND